MVTCYNLPMSTYELSFLLGAFFSRLIVNERDNLRHGLVITLPVTKQWLALRMHQVLGGSLFLKTNNETQSVCLTIKSREDLRRLRKLMTAHSEGMPGLRSFTKLLSRSREPVIKGIIPRRPRKPRKVRKQSLAFLPSPAVTDEDLRQSLDSRRG